MLLSLRFFDLVGVDYYGAVDAYLENPDGIGIALRVQRQIASLYKSYSYHT